MSLSVVYKESKLLAFYDLMLYALNVSSQLSKR